MQRTDENLIWATEMLQRVGHLPGFPITTGQLLAVANELLNFIGDQPEHSYPEDGGPDVGEIWVKTKAVSAGETGEWLMGQVIARCERFPTGVKMRELYESRFSPADGLRSADLAF